MEDTEETVISAYQFHQENLTIISFTPDHKKDWYTEATPLHMEVEQGKDGNNRNIKHCMRTLAELGLEPDNTGLRQLIKRLLRFTMEDKALL